MQGLSTAWTSKLDIQRRPTGWGSQWVRKGEYSQIAGIFVSVKMLETIKNSRLLTPVELLPTQDDGINHLLL